MQPAPVFLIDSTGFTDEKIHMNLGLSRKIRHPNLRKYPKFLSNGKEL